MGANQATARLRSPRPGRPTKPLITRESAARTAIAIVDDEGLDGLSLQAVARRMGVTAPSLYYHFRNKDDLLRLVAEALLFEVGQSVPLEMGWEERSIALSVAVRRVILAHAEAAPLLLRYFPRQLMLGSYEESLRACPYDPRHHIVIIEALENLTFGATLFAAAAQAAGTAPMPEFDTARYPRLGTAVTVAPDDDEARFVEQLRALLEGFRARYGIPRT